MQYNQLGRSDLQVSKIGFGCMSLKNNAAAAGIIEKAIDKGINFFDTADLYENGANEEMLGKILGAKRKDLIIATKVGNQMRPDGSGWDWNPRKEYILESVEKSLKRLQTDYIDLYQLHGGTIDDPIDETIEAFELLRKQGKIRHYGISSIRPNVIREYADRSGIVSVMMQYSLLDRRPEEESFNVLQQNGISVLARGVVAQGLLINKEPSGYLDYSKQAVAEAQQVIHRVAGNERTATQTAVLFALSNPVLASAVVGIRTIEQLDDAAGALDVPPLSAEEIELLRTALPTIRYTAHR